ncbi:MAG TPA: hypothetical protein VJB06_04865, partial [archaeon]|nr:hypothetical protein [archaeon]
MKMKNIFPILILITVILISGCAQKAFKPVSSPAVSEPPEPLYESNIAIVAANLELTRYPCRTLTGSICNSQIKYAPQYS